MSPSACYNAEDTIVGLSTPSGISLHAILRVSGRYALDCVSCIFIPNPTESFAQYWNPKVGATPNNPCTNSNLLKRAATYSSIKGYIFIAQEHISIPAALYLMKAPNSYTREDVVEIHTFGSPPLLEMILSELLSNTKQPVRIAEPGEFTKRAFLNGRIDLSQAEAVMRIIRSRTDAELHASMSHLNGRLKHLIIEIKEELLDLCSRIEASIDFSDQDISLISCIEIKQTLCLILNKLLQLISDRDSGGRDIFVEGINIALYGSPNVGKSSLLNTFNPPIKAIVSEFSHTTRDSVKRTIRIGDLDFNFIDNPGIDRMIDIIECGDCQDKGIHTTLQSNSIARALKALDSADIILFVLDGSSGLNNTDINLFNRIKERKKIVVVNKVDLPQKINLSALANGKDGLTIVRTSTVTGEGLEELKKSIMKLALGGIDQSGSHLIVNARQKTALHEMINFLNYAIKSAEDGESLDLIALDLRSALEALGEITGSVATDDILDKIFSDFCIGK